MNNLFFSNQKYTFHLSNGVEKYFIFSGIKLFDKFLLDEYEEMVEYRFPKFYKEAIEVLNGASSSKSFICWPDSTSAPTEQDFFEIDRFLSFNTKDEQSVWNIHDEMMSRDNTSDYDKFNLVPFAIMKDGSYLCIHRNTDEIFIWRSSYNRGVIAENLEDLFIRLMSEDEKDNLLSQKTTDK